MNSLSDYALPDEIFVDANEGGVKGVTSNFVLNEVTYVILIGKGSERYAMHIKGMENREYMRSLKGWALGIAVAIRGGGHTTGSVIAEPNLSYEGKPEQVIYTERIKAVLDSLGLCHFVYGPGLIEDDDLAKLVTKATGFDYSVDKLMMIGEAIHNVGKAFNTLNTNFSRADDYPPARLMEEPIKSGPYRGELLDKREWDKMLDKYYQLHGWGTETGLQKKQALEQLGLHELSEELRLAGKLP